MRTFIAKFRIILLLIFVFVFSPHDFVLAAGDDVEKEIADPIEIRAPKPVIQIPGLKLSGSEIIDPVTEYDDVYIESPFLAEYLAAIYRYSIYVIVIISILVIIVSGLQWTISGGNAATIGSAKKRIIAAITGTLLALGSYSILYIINPNLLTFTTLRTFYVSGVDLDNLVILERNEPLGYSGTAGKGLSNNAFDDLFRSFANCPTANGQRINWKYLKAVGYMESALTPTAGNDRFKGLFAIGKDLCRGIITNKYPQWQAKCGGSPEEAAQNLFNPVLNTAAGTANAHSNLAKAQKLCPTTTKVDLLSMLMYTAHNSGAGALSKIVKSNSNVCTSVETLQNEIIKYWLAQKPPKKGTLEKRAETRKNSITKVAKFTAQLKVTDMFDTSDNGTAACPLSQSPDSFKWSPPTNSGSGNCPVPQGINCTNSRGKKIIAIGDSMTQGPQYVEKLAQACGHTIIANTAVASAKTGSDFGGPKSLKAQFQELVSSGKLAQADDLIILGGANDIASGSAIKLTNPQSPEDNLLDIYKQAKSQGLRVIAITMSPWENYRDGKSWSDSRKNRLDTLNGWIRRKGPDGGGGTYIDVVIDFYSKAQNGNAICSSLTRDGIHLNKTGASLLAGMIASQAY